MIGTAILGAASLLLAFLLERRSGARVALVPVPVRPAARRRR